MKRPAKLAGRSTKIGAALVTMAAGLVVPLAALGGSTPAGADTPQYTMQCTSSYGPSLLPGLTMGTISANPVAPGGTFTIKNYGFQLDLSSEATQLNGFSVSVVFTTSVTTTGASPSSVNTTINIPPYPISPGHATPSGTGSAGTFTADSNGATEVTVSPGETGNMSLTIGAPLNLTETATCVITNSGGTPITPPVMDSVPIAVPAGSISAVLPNASPLAGGTAVVIHGTNLAGATKVFFGQTPARSFTQLSPDAIAAVAPAGTAGTVAVRVVTSAGSSIANPGDAFTYTDGPIVTRVSPSTGPPSGGTSVTISGSSFTGATAVDFGSAAATFTVDSATRITATAPAGTGAVNVTVHGPSGVSVVSAQDRFNYRTGYWLVAADGGVFAYGNAPFEGSAGNLALNAPVVGMTATPDHGGYWLVAADGGVFAYGDAGFFGSAGNLTLDAPIVGMAATPDGFGYWLVAADGGVFAYGDAGFFGSAGNLTLGAPIVGMATTPDGGGYWLVGADGGVFAYGDARFFGSSGEQRLSSPVVGIAPTADGAGYWMVTCSGAVLNYGDAGNSGSAAGIRLRLPVVGIGAASGDSAYWLAAGDGGVFAYGGAAFDGSAAGDQLNSPVIGISVA
ncbi:MAG: IPT/TIG domain-containing protein [Acidimicrobiales bacterium]